MEDVAVSFPRGGGRATTPRDKEDDDDQQEPKNRKLRPSEITKKRKASAESSSPDFLFGQHHAKDDGAGGAIRGSNDNTKHKKSKHTDGLLSTTAKQSLLPLGGGGVVVKAVSKASSKSAKTSSSSNTHTNIVIEALSFAKLAKGTKLLGVVREVQDEFAIVSLPNLLTGYMLRQDGQKTKLSTSTSSLSSSFSLKHVVAVHQVLTVVVQKVAVESLPGGRGETKRRIQVSALPTHVNPRDTTSTSAVAAAATSLWRGQVLSVEDHGCLIDLGLGRQGFVKFDHIEGEYSIMEGDDAVIDMVEEDPDPVDAISSSSTKNKTQNDKKKKKRKHAADKPRILQPGRLYDFVTATAASSSSSTTTKADAATTVLSLKLPLVSKVAQQMTMPQVALPGKKHSSGSTGSYTLSSLQPGMLVTAKVEALAKNGLCVTFLQNIFRGAIELGPHMMGGGGGGGGTGTDDAWRSLFQQHVQHFPARIIAIDVPSKLIRLSLAPHILAWTPAPTPVTVGTTLEHCPVVRVDAGIGALLALPESYHLPDNTIATTVPKKLLQQSDLFKHHDFVKAMSIPTVYVHISKAYDDPDEIGNKKKTKQNKQDRRNVHTSAFPKDFALGSQHTVRVLNTGHGLDGVVSGGCAPSLLEAHVLTHADLQPGQVYTQVPIVARLEGGSVLVNLGGSPGNPVRGLIPSPLHLMDHSVDTQSEYRRKVMEAKFAVDSKVDVRVLTVDHAKKKCILTAKKGLVKVEDEEKFKVVTSYDDFQVGMTTVGFVSKIDNRALYVTFCNKVYAKVTAKSLALELGVDNHQEQYHVGDVVKCRVVQVRKTTQARSSLEEQDEDAGDDENMHVDEEAAKPRAFYQVLLSLKLQDASPIDDEDVAMEDEATKMDPTQAKQVHIQAGAILPEKSMKIVELFKGKPGRGNKHFVPGYAIVSIKSKYLVDESERAHMLPQMECKLPFDQLMDHYGPEDMESAEALDAMAAGVLKVGKKINQQAIVLTDPHKSNVDHSSGIGRLTVVSLRKSLIATMEKQATADASEKDDSKQIRLPNPKTHLFVGALVQGYVAHIDSRHGAFLRFLDGMTGLIPRRNGGLDLTPYSTIVAKIRVIDDTVKPFRLLLEPLEGVTKKADHREPPFNVGDVISAAEVKGVGFLETKLQVLGEDRAGLKNVPVKIHATMKDAPNAKMQLHKTKTQKGHCVKGHPFYGMKTGDILTNLTVVFIERGKGRMVVHVTDRAVETDEGENSVAPPTFINKRSQVKAGMVVEATVTDFGAKNKGLYVMVSPLVKGYIPGLELSQNLNVLNAISSHVPLGARLTCVVMDESQWHENRAKSPFASRTQKSWTDRKSTPEEKRDLYLSVLAVSEPTLGMEKPTRNDLIIGRINKNLPQYQAPSLMLSLRGGFVARCCVTELAEVDEWENMPLGIAPTPTKKRGKPTDKMDEDKKDDAERDDQSSSSESDNEEDEHIEMEQSFADGKYIKCRVLKSLPKQSLVEVSLRESRLEGDLDEDVTPLEDEIVQAFVIETNKKGCFVRLARHIEGRATLTELCNGFLPDPTASFPPGRLVVGKIKSINPVQNKSKNSKSSIRFKVDLDMRESTLLDTKKALKFEDIELQSKHKGTVTRVESYGVFVQIENSKVSGLTHLSECSDNFVKNLATLYSPGDPVKVLVIKKDDEEKKIGFSMKASHFEDDEDSEDDSSMEGSEEEKEEVEEGEQMLLDGDLEDLDSDDENYGSKLAARMAKTEPHNALDRSHDEDSSQSGSGSDSESESDSEDDENKTPALDTNVGFDFGFNGTGSSGEAKTKHHESSDESDSSDSDSDDEDETGKGTSHKSRKKQAQRRREEQEISKREIALADGTADENPETAGDFERLLAGDPNSSELWIRYMAFHLSLADIPAARLVANKALDRIEFREEGEKLNVWTALLTLEHKYGNEESLRKTIERACGQNNPKQVYLRVCEILEKDMSSPETVARADAMYSKMCSKFKSKKKTWLAHLSYLSKQSRYEEAHSLLKRALLSLAPYKHAETMAKFAQMEYEFGSPERARTLFDGILAKYPKRLDLFFVYVDKEVKFGGNYQTARSLLETKIENGKLSDKQVKSVFKKWYTLEELHGDEESMEHVKETARKYVQRTTSN